MISGLKHFQLVKAMRVLVTLTSGTDHQTRFRSYRHLFMSFSTFFIAPDWLRRNRTRERHREKISSGLILGSIPKWTVNSETEPSRNFIANGYISKFWIVVSLSLIRSKRMKWFPFQLLSCVMSQECKRMRA